MTKPTNNKNSQQYITKKELYEFGMELTDTILTGMQNMFDRVEERFEQIDKRFEQIDKRFNKLEKNMGHKFNYLETKIDTSREHQNKIGDKIAFFHPNFSHI